jgi:hypothetical protein
VIVAYKIVFLRVRIKRFYNDGKYCRNILKKEKIVKKKRVQVKGCFTKKMVVFLGVMVFFFVAGAVQAAQPVADPSRFQEVAGSNGTILRDNNTGLEWQRCAYGQSWTGSGCSGTPWEGRWDDAVRITAPGGFRVPTVDELNSLAPFDQSIFPGSYWFWSSSSNDDRAWILNFNCSFVQSISKNGCSELRLVRTGQ